MIRLRTQPKRKGAALVEYGLLVAGITVVSAAALSIFGHKTSDLLALSAAILPGAHADDNAPIVAGKVIETTSDADGNLVLDTNGIATNGANNSRLGDNLGIDVTTLVVEAE